MVLYHMLNNFIIIIYWSAQNRKLAPQFVAAYLQEMGQLP